MSLHANISEIRAIVLDVDGVLTDGRIGYGPFDGEIKYFSVLDGHGIKLAMRAGLKVGILSGRASEANRKRARELGLSFLIEGCHDKRAGFEQLLKDENLRGEECMYIGDDVVDIPPMNRCGFAVAVANAVPETAAVCDYRTQRNGGEGAVREAIEFLLKGQGKWETVLARYFS